MNLIFLQKNIIELTLYNLEMFKRYFIFQQNFKYINERNSQNLSYRLAVTTLLI